MFGASASQSLCTCTVWPSLMILWCCCAKSKWASWLCIVLPWSKQHFCTCVWVFKHVNRHTHTETTYSRSAVKTLCTVFVFHWSRPGPNLISCHHCLFLPAHSWYFQTHEGLKSSCSFRSRASKSKHLETCFQGIVCLKKDNNKKKKLIHFFFPPSVKLMPHWFSMSVGNSLSGSVLKS